MEDSKIILLGNQHVSDAISTDYLYKWTPATPVIISAQTGSGKNTFIEDVIIKQMVKLNGKILILSNRIALGRQEKGRIAELMDKIAPRENCYSSYAKDVEKRSSAPAWLDELEDFGPVTIKSYQSFLARENDLAEYYDFVIFDECHFFLADAKFNKYTYHILDTIVKRYPYSIRLYMTATPDEVVNPILKVEYENSIVSNLNKRVRPIVLRTLPDSVIRWEPDFSKYTLDDYRIGEQYKPLYTKKYSYNYGGGEKQYYTYETYNSYSAIIYEFERDYSYIICKYLECATSSSNNEDDDRSKFINQCKPLLNLIRTQIDEDAKKSTSKIEKWLIFVANKKDGQDLLGAIGNEYAEYIDAGSKNNDVYVKICNEGKFEKKVLISTSVIDNGINITDTKVKHVVIFAFDKVAFLQMLGRKRVELNEKITLYLAEKSIKGLNWRLQENRRTLERIRRNAGEQEELIKGIVDSDDVFFYIDHECNSKNSVGYNRFLVDKLKNDIAFLEKVLKNNGNTNQTLQDESKKINRLTYEKYIKRLKSKGKNIGEEKNTELYSFGEKTIIEQLSWMGLEDTFNSDNYLKEVLKIDEGKIQKSVNAFMKFLECHSLEEEIPSDGKPEFFRQKGMAPNEQDKFCANFTELYRHAFEPQISNNREPLRLTTIRKLLKEQSLLYEIISEQIDLTEDEKKRFNLNQKSATFWVIKKQK